MREGDLTVITGPMFAGKTAALIERLAQYATFRAFKPLLDDRYAAASIGTHDGEEVSAHPVDATPHGLSRLLDVAYARDPRAVGIDEAQFFPNELLNVVVELTTNGFDVVVAGLNTDFTGGPFEPVPVLADLADETIVKAATCDSCGSEATRSQRLVDGEPAPEDAPQVRIGGSETYEARCQDCHAVQKVSQSR